MLINNSKIVSILIVLALALNLNGCNKENVKIENSNLNSTGMPIVKEKINLKAMVLKHPEHGDYEKMDFTRIMEEKTNIHIDWQVVPLGQEVNDKKALAFASGNMPDMFFIVSIMTGLDIATYGPSGLLQPLNELIDKYAPNVQKMLQVHPEYKTDITFEDGNIYSLPEVSDEKSSMAYYKTKMYINQKWLTTLGLTMPKTTDELYNVLKSFKTGDPNGNGIQDEIPFSSVNIDPAMMGPWGLSYWWDLDMMTIKNDRKVTYTPMDQGFKQGLQYWHKLFAEGLLDNDVMSMTTDTLKQKLTTTDEQVGCFMSYADYGDYGEERSKDYTLVPPLEGPTGLKSMTNMTPRIQFMPHFFVMSSTCKNKEAAMRWVDYLYSEEGTLLTKYGENGKAYTIQPDGKIKDTIKENIPRDANGNPTVEFWDIKMAPGYVLPQYWSQTIIDKFIIPDETNIGVIQSKLCYEYYNPVKPKYMMKDILFSKQDIQRLSELASQVHPVFNQYFASFITGESSIDSQWDTYVSGFKTMGVDEMVAIYQKYIDKIYPAE